MPADSGTQLAPAAAEIGGLGEHLTSRLLLQLSLSDGGLDGGDDVEAAVVEQRQKQLNK